MYIERILIVDPDYDHALSLRSSISSGSRPLHVDCAHNATQALNLMSLSPYDILISEMSLPDMENREFINRVHAIMPEASTGTIIVSDIKTNDSVQTAELLGVDCYLMKPVSDSALHDCIFNMLLKRYNNRAHTNNLDRRLSAILLACGIAPHVRGFAYIRESVKLICNAPPYRPLMLTKDIYPVVAEMFSTRPMSVERGIRHAIDTAWNNSVNNDLRWLLGSAIYRRRSKPTNGEFISIVADRLLLKNEEDRELEVNDSIDYRA